MIHYEIPELTAEIYKKYHLSFRYNIYPKRNATILNNIETFSIRSLLSFFEKEKRQ